MFRLNTDEPERHSEVEHHHVASTSFEGSHGKLLEYLGWGHWGWQFLGAWGGAYHKSGPGGDTTGLKRHRG
ncbi:hypothetical protein NQ317_011631 [Molorchus minor]|uniref:Uncharacterized protein n=1 Tax=Molorchus minor TaxID=1323400 RepID=A0ABQ9J4P2_9CUCU|nr:hypothetical protein NQ317_011631 [Molorchus minor]